VSAPKPPPLPAALLFAQGESRLAALDALARSQWLGGMINSQGTWNRASASSPPCVPSCWPARCLPPPTGTGRHRPSSTH
jgi:hypothetical protein